MISSFGTRAALALAVAGLASCVDLSGDEDIPSSGDEAAEVHAKPDGSWQIIEPDGSPQAASDCPVGWFCLWHDANFVGRRLQFQGTGCQNLGDFGFNDQASSYNNRNAGSYAIYRDAGCVNRIINAGAGAQSSSLGGNNDQASSICRGTCP